MKSFILLCGRFYIWEFPVDGFNPHVDTTGCSELHMTTLNPTSWSMKEVSVRWTRQLDYAVLLPSLSRRSLTMGLQSSPWYVCGYPMWMHCICDWKTVLRVIRKKSLKIWISRRVADQLSPHHDSQFSAFSTEVLNRTNQKHNHSSSPFTTLAD